MLCSDWLTTAPQPQSRAENIYKKGWETEGIEFTERIQWNRIVQLSQRRQSYWFKWKRKNVKSENMLLLLNLRHTIMLCLWWEERKNAKISLFYFLATIQVTTRLLQGSSSTRITLYRVNIYDLVVTCIHTIYLCVVTICIYRLGLNGLFYLYMLS